MSNEFLTDLFGDQEGYVYAPVKDPNWHQHFFIWPQECDRLEAHINNFNQRDVYLSPAIFTEPIISPESFKGTNYLWTEFDGTVPINVDQQPSIRVSSSTEGHEHWYWRLDEFITDINLIQDLNRRIAYHYGADLSVWDYQQVLRPVDTWNHKRNKPVTLLENNHNTHSIKDFLWVPIPPPGSKVEISLQGLPTKDSIIEKYHQGWKYDALDLLFKNEIVTGKRSDALVRLAYECIETGLSNDEVYVLLEDRDSVWGKFVGRTDRQKRLEGIIASVRKRKAVNAEITQDAPEVYRFYDFMQTKINLKWAIEGLLPVAGSMVIFGKPGIGKSTFSLRLAMDLALGKDKFLLWNIVNRQRVLFISLEMQHYELKEFFNDMQLPIDQQQQLQEQFFIWPIGNAYPLDTPDQQVELIKYIKMHKIELIIIDSLSLAMFGKVTDDHDVKKLNAFLNEDVRKALHCGYIFIHHPRKEGVGEDRKTSSLDDSFGSGYIGANAQTVVTLTQGRGSSRIHVKLEKTRMSIGMTDFYIERTPDRGYVLASSGTTNPPPVKTTVVSDNPERTESSNKGAAMGALGKLFGV